MRTFVDLFPPYLFSQKNVCQHTKMTIPPHRKHYLLLYGARIRQKREGVSLLMWQRVKGGGAGKVWYFLSFLAGQEEKKVRNHSPIQPPGCAFGWSTRKKNSPKHIFFFFTPPTCQGIMEGSPCESKDPQ